MDPIEGEFICRKCQKQLSIGKIMVSKKGFALFEVQCSNKHAGKRKFNMQQQNEWMPSVIKHLYECPKCGFNLTDIRQRTEGDKTLLLLNCPTHGKIKKVVSTSFWYSMDALRKQLSARPAYPPAYPGPYPPQQYPPGQYPPTYPQQPSGPYSTQKPNTFTQPPASASPETITPPQIGGVPQTPTPGSPSSPIDTQISPTGSNIDAGDFCPACGEEITPGAKFCTNCGTEID
ncbi:MAG: zinc-ribbon domain-containing protein [Candidatus Helarchaeota archaeon]|nr:zinc-ribbon domain-containing protein [Candidatus Helarchaeota archaeon]